MDWAEWHQLYKTEASLQERIEIVCEQISHTISVTRASPVRLLSLCAGDGRDVILSTASLQHRKPISATLLEIDSDLVMQGRLMAEEHGLEEEISFHCSDATKLESYSDLPTANIVVISGVFGNLKQKDVKLLVGALPSLCEPKARVIWTRNLNEFDDGNKAVEHIRKMFAESDFVETTYVKTPSGVYAVGTHTYEGETQELPTRPVLFQFSGFWEVAGDA